MERSGVHVKPISGSGTEPATGSRGSAPMVRGQRANPHKAKQLLTFARPMETTNLPYFLSICKLIKLEFYWVLFPKRHIHVSSLPLGDFGVTSNAYLHLSFLFSGMLVFGFLLVIIIKLFSLHVMATQCV